MNSTKDKEENQTSTSTSKNTNAATIETETAMDESQDKVTTDATGDTIMKSTPTEYDSDGNNLYGTEDTTSVSDQTTVANNESPNKRQKSTPKKLAPIIEKNRTISVCKTRILYVAGIPVKKTKKAMDEYHRAIKEFLKEIKEYDSTAILYEM